ncbi:hypothetical protein CJE1109 [Campylobacter jejuni RM1221]|uniref:hypothetical protein n=1 Tax=Campylobacter jejuni TaxID=197 RepID=UPI00004B573D|nr:hypothetical protein [Campylobacter jejuni]AAW35437.1 hypothetical protein CJE1109 [Campylobacter jejuni RM1221]ATL96623.1 hypothetical protein CRM97_07360 [Campylobacter jejuni]
MQKILQIDLEKRKALENFKNLALLGLGGTMLLNLKEQALDFSQELTYINTYDKYLNLKLDSFYIPSTLLSLLQLTQKSKEAFYINVLINSDTHYKNPLLQYAITQKQKQENIVYALKNNENINASFANLNALKLALEEKNFYLNFIDLNSKESLLSFYNQIISNNHFRNYFYIKNNQFFIKKDIKNKILFHSIHSSIISNYLRLLNDFNTLSKIELINILESLSLYNLSTLIQTMQTIQSKNEYNSKDFDKDSIFLSNMIMNVRLK